MQDIITLLTNNGIGVVCVGFLIYFINETLKNNNKILDEVKETLISIQNNLNNLTTRINEIENQINRKGE